jgi:riboflavin biosynthesis pyrimidine reductase
VRRLLPDPAEDLTDEDLVAAYASPERWLRVNFVESVDGAVTVDGVSAGLSSPADKRVFGLLRDLADVVLVAAGTIRGEGYGYPDFSERRRARRTALGLAEWPTFAILSRSLDLDLSSSLFRDPPARTVVLTTGDATNPELAERAEVRRVRDLREARDSLPARVLCEGGPGLFASLVAAGLADELCLSLAPLLAGPGPGRIVAGDPHPPAALTLGHVLEEDGMLFLRYLREGA